MELVESRCLVLYKGSHRFGGVATPELDGKRVLGQRYTRLVLVRLERRLKEYTETGRLWVVAHVTSREEMLPSEGKSICWDKMIGRRRDMRIEGAVHCLV